MTVQWDVGCIPRKRAELHPDKRAIIFEDQPITYRELNEGVNRCAHLFQSKGILKGDRIAVVLLNCVEFLEAYFAAAKLGAIFVPLNWRLAPPELEYQLNDCGARMVLVHDSFLTNLDSVRRKVKVEEDKFIFLVSGSPTMPGFAMPGCPDWAEAYHGLVEQRPAAEPIPDTPVRLDDPLAILYTSGTTGNPKGAVLSHGQTYFKNFQIATYTGGTPEDVNLGQVPLFHSAGLFISATPALCGGTTLLMRRGFDPNEFAEDIQRYRATVVGALTTMWRMILETGKLDEIDTSSVRVVIGGGERTPPSLFEELAKRGLYMQQGFGQTENSFMTLLPKEDVFRKMGSIGKPGFFTDVWIARQDGTRAAPGEIGEFVARGPTVMSGYWNLPEKTEEAIRDGVLKTGDLGYMDEEGYFYIVDRAKDMYRSGAENVYPAEVEKVLAGHPKISNVAVIGVPDEKWGETGLAFVLPAQGETVTQEEILEFLTDKVARFKHPKTILFVDDLPVTATMKVKKEELKKRYVAGR
jgi:fatty-acyl-CoA synthase